MRSKGLQSWSPSVLALYRVSGSAVLTFLSPGDDQVSRTAVFRTAVLVSLSPGAVSGQWDCSPDFSQSWRCIRSVGLQSWSPLVLALYRVSGSAVLIFLSPGAVSGQWDCSPGLPQSWHGIGSVGLQS
ncbi:hypothetical protein PoB_001303900 [Plakobranchus ocellatus]|uniref:Uncharacterized protein n=1 Tax=Plakobranchus ocellatus TaxID=259542 RepID=A0AAV3YTZ4_9GAST|nr:hypothetical protein PoB_001303900 [Plakobranchus ocellatus]